MRMPYYLFLPAICQSVKGRPCAHNLYVKIIRYAGSERPGYRGLHLIERIDVLAAAPELSAYSSPITR